MDKLKEGYLTKTTNQPKKQILVDHKKMPKLSTNLRNNNNNNLTNWTNSSQHLFKFRIFFSLR